MSGTRAASIITVAIFSVLLFTVADAGAAGTTTIVQRNYRFSPSTVTVTAGSTLLIRNATASTPHTFTVSGHGIDVQTQGGSSAPVAVDLPPGRYPFICRFHVSLGMRGTLVVLGSGPTPTAAPGVSAVPVGAPQTGAGGTASRPFPLTAVALGSILLLGGALGIVRRRTLRHG
jgi:plastocyanin